MATEWCCNIIWLWVLNSFIVTSSRQLLGYVRMGFLKRESTCDSSCHHERISHASGYKQIVKALVPRKQNTATKSEHIDLHYSRTEVAYMNEMFSQFGTATLSADNKNKISLGTPVVSQYHHISSFFLQDDTPNYFDHEFNSKIVLSSVLLMKKKGVNQSCRWSLSLSSHNDQPNVSHCSSLEPRCGVMQDSLEPSTDDHKLDKHGRLHMNFPETGELTVFNLATNCISSCWCPWNRG